MTAAPARAAIARIPERSAASGPLTHRRTRRLLFMYSALAVAGTLLALVGPPFWQGFGLGMWFPGAGFALGFGTLGNAVGYGAAMLLSILLFGIGFMSWFGAGNIVAPVAVWIGTAIAAGMAVPSEAWGGAYLLVPALVIGSGLAAGHRMRRAHAQAIATRDRRNRALVERSAALPAYRPAEVRELDTDTLGLMRHVLDLNLSQPVDGFEGFEWGDQFQFGSLRYALDGMGYALAGVQYGATPAFRGYLSEAQRRLQGKLLHHRNWKYWRWENAWGHLSLDPNPITDRDNVMYHGWFMAMLGEYMSNTGDYSANNEPMVLRHPNGREWRYTFSEVCEVLYNSHRKSAFTLFPCEPNWIYPMCNNFSLIALKIHDRLFGTSWFADIADAYRHSFNNEFCTADGRVLAIRSALTGITLPMLTSAMADSITAHFLHGTFPDLARRSWEIARLDYIRVASGELDITTRGWDKLDTGNYKPSMITTYAQIGAAAAEMGDEEVATLLRKRIRDEFSWRDVDGATRLEGCSSQAQGMTLYHFAAHANLRHDMHARGMPEHELHGPILDEAPYPDVLVAYARNDGAALDLVLRPGRPGSEDRRHTLGLAQLRPGTRYRCEGAGEARIDADANGNATLDIALQGRTALRIVPVS